MPDPIALLQLAAAGLSLNLVAEFIIAAAWTRRKVREDTLAAVAAAKADLLADLTKLLTPPAVGALRGDMDPADLNDRKAAKAAKRTRTEVAILAELGSRFGPVKSRMVWEWLSEETRARVIAAGDRYNFVLEPLLAKLPPTLHVDNDATKEPPVAMQTY